MTMTMPPITLDTPIKRGENEILFIILRKPDAGALRGVTLTDLLQMDVGSLIRVVPRISEPTLTESEVAKMDPADLTQIGAQVAGFLLPKSAMAEAGLAPASPSLIQ